ncbi:hypothetical protein DL764_004436 [Monosporascus ibericus]|uniref:DUF7888 domain-containing protein n=1 Tax=Monosporascus ibericus TaxID=155417 RepID=A0A4Q4TCL9_9PEZI|nr:hypothetical protein DL764_004436 [Monosporascus ibericus]
MPSFKTIAASMAIIATMANAAPANVKTEAGHARSVSLQKREPVTATILTAAGTALVTAVIQRAVTEVADLIGDIASFDAGREAFTKQTTDAMFAQNPDPARFQAAACYNQAFSFADPANVDGQTSVEFRQGLLNTDYECFFIAAPNQFFTEGDGGFINLSITHSDRCTFDSATSDLTCV